MYKLSLLKIAKIVSDTTRTSWQFFRKNPLVQDITIFDLAMQLASFLLWNLYLSYTAVRCVILLTKYSLTFFQHNGQHNRHIVWRQIQLYTTTKVTGIVISQVLLVIAGISTVGWALCVLMWGSLLGSISCYAYLRSKRHLMQ